MILSLAVFGGCTANRPPSPPTQASHETIDIEPFETAENTATAALVFDPIILADASMLDLGRDGRDAAAYWGLQGPMITYFWQQTDDLYGDVGGWGRGNVNGRYRRHTIETKVGTSVR